MARSVWVEPSCYVFASTAPQSAREELFEHFWPTFLALQRFVELNDARMPLTADLRDAIETMFPYADLARSRETDPLHPFEAVSLVIRFLEKHAARPLAEFEDQAAYLTGMNLVRTAPVYINDDVWLAWTDLLAQLVRIVLASGRDREDLLAAPAYTSCVPADGVVRLDTAHGVRVFIDTYCMCEGRWPGTWLDPDAYASMLTRRRTDAPSVRWEASGHLPSRTVQKVLVRTATDVREFVGTVATTYRADSVAESCKLTRGSTSEEVGFRVSDGHVTFKGVFLTVARNAAEQAVALALLDRSFRSRCVEVGFVVQEPT